MTGRLRLYPNRKRCLACRSYFGFIVVDGLFCSYRCAGMPKPSIDPADWPRGHYSQQPGTTERRAKRDWMYQAQAEREARKNGKTPYRCSYCLGWHIGTPAPGKRYPADLIKVGRS